MVAACEIKNKYMCEHELGDKGILTLIMDSKQTSRLKHKADTTAQMTPKWNNYTCLQIISA